MKGISTALVIVVTIIVLLVVAVVVLTFFGVNIGNMGQMISDWLKQVTQAPTTICTGKGQAECSILTSCSWCQTEGRCVRVGESCT